MSTVRAIMGDTLTESDSLAYNIGTENHLEHLPNEIILRIFEGILAGHVGHRHTITLSHISRRLREIAFEFSQLWTTLRSTDRADKVAAFVHRSGDADLHILCVPGRRQSEQTQAVMKIITENCERWGWITVLEGVDYRVQLRLAEVLETQHLPQLQEIKWDNSRPLSTNFIDLRLYDVPRLYYFTGHNVLPSQNGSSSASFLICDLTLTNTTRLSIRLLTKLLMPCQNLDTLILTISNTYCEIGDPKLSIILPSLARLSVTVGRRMDLRVLTLFQYISLPGLLTLGIEIVDCQRLTKACFDAILHPRGQELRRTVSEFILVTPEKLDAEDILTQVVHHLPSVQHLTIMARNMNFPISEASYQRYSLNELPCLVSLSFESCDQLEECQLRLLIKSLCSGEHWDRFRILAIVKCHRISMEFLETLRKDMPGKLVRDYSCQFI